MGTQSSFRYCTRGRTALESSLVGLVCETPGARPRGKRILGGVDHCDECLNILRGKLFVRKRVTVVDAVKSLFERIVVVTIEPVLWSILDNYVGASCCVVEVRL